MEANNFYNAWNDAVTAQEPKATLGTQVMEKLDMFDDLDDVIADITGNNAVAAEDDMDLDDLLFSESDVPVYEDSDNTASSEHLEPSSENLQTVEASSPATIQVMNNNGVASFNKKIQTTSQKKQQYAETPLENDITVWCLQWDYTCDNFNYVDALKSVFNCSTKEDVIVGWLNAVFGIITDVPFDAEVLRLSHSFIEAVYPPFRRMYFSELLILASYINDPLFDPAIMKVFTLESRDTGAIAQLMKLGKFVPEEALVYTGDLDIFNAYLSLKISDKYQKEQFDTVMGIQGNLNNYTKAMLSGDTWAFLGNHKDFNDILNVIHDCDELQKEDIQDYAQNPWLLDIVKAYKLGLFSKQFIDMFLVKENRFAEQMAKEYGLARLDKQLLHIDGDFYAAKLLYVAKKFSANTDNLSEYLTDPNTKQNGHNFARIILESVWDDKCTEEDWEKFVYCLVNHPSQSLPEKVVDFYRHYRAIEFNQFYFNSLLNKLEIKSKLPSGIGELIVLRSSKSAMYLNIQILCEAEDVFVESIRNKLGNEFAVKLLPEHAGIIISAPDFNDFDQERNKFQNINNASCSLSTAIASGNIKSVSRYNAENMVKIAQTQTPGVVTESFKQLLQIPLQSYLIYDNMLSIISKRFNMFVGLCMCAESVQCLKIFNEALQFGSLAEVQIEFLRIYLGFKFRDRVQFDRYNANALQPINVVEVIGSYVYGSVSYMKVISTLDEFTMELNKKPSIRCNLDTPNKMIFRRF